MDAELSNLLISLAATAFTTVVGAFLASEWWKGRTNAIQRKIADMVFASVARVAHDYVEVKKAAATNDSPEGKISQAQAETARSKVKQELVPKLLASGLKVSEPEIETQIEIAVQRLKEKRPVQALKGAGA